MWVLHPGLEVNANAMLTAILTLLDSVSPQQSLASPVWPVFPETAWELQHGPVDWTSSQSCGQFKCYTSCYTKACWYESFWKFHTSSELKCTNLYRVKQLEGELWYPPHKDVRMAVQYVDLFGVQQILSQRMLWQLHWNKTTEKVVSWRQLSLPGGTTQGLGATCYQAANCSTVMSRSEECGVLPCGSSK